jgi:hypothetical protein
LTQSQSAELKKIIMVKQFSAYAALAGLIAAVSARPTARSTETWGQLRENVSGHALYLWYLQYLQLYVCGYGLTKIST